MTSIAVAPFFPEFAACHGANPGSPRQSTRFMTPSSPRMTKLPSASPLASFIKLAALTLSPPSSPTPLPVALPCTPTMAHSASSPYSSARAEKEYPPSPPAGQSAWDVLASMDLSLGLDLDLGEPTPKNIHQPRIPDLAYSRLLDERSTDWWKDEDKPLPFVEQRRKNSLLPTKEDWIRAERYT